MWALPRALTRESPTVGWYPEAVRKSARLSRPYVRYASGRMCSSSAIRLRGVSTSSP